VRHCCDVVSVKADTIKINNTITNTGLDLDLDNNCQSPGGYYGNEVYTSTGTTWQRAGF